MRRIPRVSAVVRLLTCLMLLLVATTAERLSILPKFALIMEVDTRGIDSELFQDRLELVVQSHLEKYFRTKFNTMGNNFNRTSLRVASSTSILWDTMNAPGQLDTDANENTSGKDIYEARADFESVLSADSEELTISDSVIDLLLIEAFQGDNYWALFRAVLENEVLSRVDTMKISVNAAGIDASNSAGNNGSTTTTGSQGGLSLTTKIGVGVAGFLFVVLALLWTFLCFFWRRSGLLDEDDDIKDFHKEETSTAKASSESDMAEHENGKHGKSQESGSWMDAWAQAVTSVPLREPVKPKKQRPIPRPAERQSITRVLSAIEEVDGDDSTCASSVASGRRTRKKHKSKSHSKRANLQAIKEDQQPVCSAMVLNAISQLSINEMFDGNQKQYPKDNEEETTLSNAV